MDADFRNLATYVQQRSETRQQREILSGALPIVRKT